MSLTRFAITLAIAGSVLTPATAGAQRSSPGYTYRLTITGRTTAPNGRATDYVVMAGHALVTEKAGRLDIDQASRSAVAGRDSYILYDSASMTIVAPKARQIVRLARATLERDLSAGSAPAATIGDVAVDVAKLGPGEPMLGISTTRWRITQDYTLTVSAASVKRSSREHVVQELWIADEKKDLANPFARLVFFPVRAAQPASVGDLWASTAEAWSRMGGAPLRGVTTATSTSSSNAATQTVSTMEVADLQAENIDDDILAPPTDYQVVALGALARSTANTQSARAGEPARVARPTATDNAAAEAKGEFVKELHSMGRRP